MSQYNDSASVQLLQVAINSATARAPMLGSLPLDLDPIEGTNDGGPAAVIAFDESKGHVNTDISGLDEPPIASSSDTKFKHGTILVPLIIPSRGVDSCFSGISSNTVFTEHSKTRQLGLWKLRGRREEQRAHG